MANITFILGNGLDINMGLRTSYSDFYDEYIKKPSPNDGTELLKKLIKEDAENPEKRYENWADFEKAFGQYSTKFSSISEYLNAFDDFLTMFYIYITELDQNVEYEKVDFDIVANQINNMIYNFTEKMNKNLKNDVVKLIKPNSPSSGGKYNFIQFNYTYVFDILLNGIQSSKMLNNHNLQVNVGIGAMGENLHVHGDLLKPVIGVDNVKQIANDVFRNNEKLVNTIVKQNYLNHLQNENVNLPIDAKKAINVINDSNLIVSYGASIGETDRFWWKTIGDWLKKGADKRLIIDYYTKDRNVRAIQTMRIKQITELRDNFQKLKKKFYSFAEWTPEDIEKHGDKVLVEHNLDLFNYKVPQKAPVTV
jgi:hypothetical protein